MRLAWREALLAFRRAPMLSALSVTTIAFSLFAFGLFGLVALNIRKALTEVEDRVEVRAFIVDGTTAEQTGAAIADVRAFPEVASVTMVTPEAALERARRELGEFKDVFDPGILPASLDVRLKEGFRDPATVKAVADRMKTYDFIDDVRYGEEWVQKLYRIRTLSTLAGMLLGLTFAAVAIIIIGSTIRMAVLARAREIAIMRLFLGGLLALLLAWSANAVIGRYVFRADFFDVRLSVLGVLAGALIGLLGSLLSVGRHLRDV
ncbi:MAG: hypothetical protein HYR75_03365 [Gemmatimonadetes bacterium]|nr:hypothetical protein [Gemmatimonadota bacterium]